MELSKLVTRIGGAACVAALPIAVSPAHGQYQVPSNYPLDQPGFNLIQAKLQSLFPSKKETLQIPPPVGYTAPSNADFEAAVGAAVASAAGSTATQPNIGLIVTAATQYNPGDASNWLQNVTNAVVGSAATNKEALLTTVTVAADSQFNFTASSTAGAITLALTKNASATASEYTAVTRQAVIDSPSTAAVTLGAQIALASNAAGQAQYNNLVTTAIQTAVSQGQSQQVPLMAFSAVFGAYLTVGTNASITTVATAALNATPANGNIPAEEVVVGALNATGTPGSSAIQTAINNSSYNSGNSKAAMTQALSAYNAIVPSNSSPSNAATALANYLGSHPNYPEASTAAVAGSYASGADTIVNAAVTKIGATNSNTPAVVYASTLSNQVLAPNILATLLKNSLSAQPAVAVSNVIAGAGANEVGPTIASGAKSLANPATNYAIFSSTAVSSSESAGYTNAVGALAYSAVAGLKSAVSADNITKSLLSGANLNSYPVDAAQVVAGAVAAAKSSASAILSNAINPLPAGQAKNNATLAYNVSNAILNPTGAAASDPLNYFNVTNSYLQANAGSTQSAQSIVYAATEANPAATSSLAALAATTSGNSSFASSIINAAVGANYNAASNIATAVNTALYTQGHGSSGLFDYIANQVLNCSYYTDIITGACIGDPCDSHIIGHGAAYGNPSIAPYIVPALFSYNTLQDHKNNLTGQAGDPVARSAAITAGVIDGVVEYNKGVTATKNGQGTSDSGKAFNAEQNAILGAVTNAVKITLILNHGNVLTAPTALATYNPSGGGSQLVKPTGPEGVTTGYVSQVADANDKLDPNVALGASGTQLTVQAILNAAAKAAGTPYVLRMAQAAADAAATVYLTYGTGKWAGSRSTSSITDPTSDTTGDYTWIVKAFEGFGLSTSQVVGAVDFGIDQAKMQNPGGAGAGAAGVGSYTVRPFSGSPVTCIFNL